MSKWMPCLQQKLTNKSYTSTFWGLAISAAAMLGGCGGYQSYRLPVDPITAYSMFPALGGCATARNLQSVEHPAPNGSVNVKYDPATWIQYMVQEPAFNMVLLLDKSVPEPERQGRYQAAKQKGDEIFACAMGSQQPPQVMMAPAPMVIPPPVQQPDGVSVSVSAGGMTAGASVSGGASVGVSASGVAPSGNDCQQLFQCYQILARDFCQPGSECRFKVEGNDPAGCRSALNQVPQLVGSLSMMRPGYGVPAECR